MVKPPVLLKRAKELFEAGHTTQAEEVLDRVLQVQPQNPTALKFRAYLFYNQDRLEESEKTYRKLVEADPGDASHYSNLGLICFKQQKVAEAIEAFEKLLQIRPDDSKAIRNLGFCHERLGDLKRAREYFLSAGEGELARQVQTRIPATEPEPAKEAVPSARERAVSRSKRAEVSTREKAAAPATRKAEILRWLEGLCLSDPGQGEEIARAGPTELICQIREKVYLSQTFLVSHRGVVVFAPAFREAGKAARKFGDGKSMLLRVEGNGEVSLSGGARRLYIFHFRGDRIFINYPALVFCSPEIHVEYEYQAAVRGRFLAARISGDGYVILAVRGSPVVLPVLHDLPTYAQPEAVVAWTEDLVFEYEKVPDFQKLFGKRESQRYRFEGRGHLLLQSLP